MNSTKKLLSVGLALAASGLVSCSIPKPECTIGQSSTSGIGLTGIAAFSVRYKLVSGTGECANLKGEVIGFQSYHPASATDPDLRDFSKTSIAIRPQSVGELYWMYQDLIGKTEDFCANVDDTGKAIDDDGDGLANDADPDCHVNGLAAFTSVEPDASDMCHTENITQKISFPGASVDVDGGVECDIANGDKDCTDAIKNVEKVACVPNDPMDPTAGNECIVTVTLPKTDLQYDWSNVSIYVTAAATGTQFSADLKLTLNGSTCDYKAIGMWPAVDCGVHDPDTFAVTGTDINFCDPNPDAAHGRPVGSGINPDFGPLTCDTGVALVPVVDDYYTNVAQGFPLSVPRCVLDSDTIPALGGFKSATGN
jgi:hypothetical protein